MTCAVPDCTTTTTNRFCPTHERRRVTYGSPYPPDPPIPLTDNPGVPDERVRELQAMWADGTLTAYCDTVLDDVVDAMTELVARPRSC